MGLMAGKQGLVMGVANDRSLAWGIAKALHGQGARLAFTYQASLDLVFADLAARWRRVDFVVHAIAFSDKDELTGKYLNTSRANFLKTLDISCFSFTDVCRRAAPLMTAGGSFLTLTYAGAERVMPHYNVMGVAKAALEASVRYLASDLGGLNIRVNAVSAGPIKTLAASGIAGFSSILQVYRDRAPLRRNVSASEVADAALFLLGPQ